VDETSRWGERVDHKDESRSFFKVGAGQNPVVRSCKYPGQGEKVARPDADIGIEAGDREGSGPWSRVLGGKPGQRNSGQRFWPSVLELTRLRFVAQLQTEIEDIDGALATSHEAVLRARSTSDRPGGHRRRSGHVPRVEELEPCQIPA
jgi:hypothetical protein